MMQVVYNIYPPHPWASAALQLLHLVLLGAVINHLGAPAAEGDGSGDAGGKAAAAAAAEAAAAASAPQKGPAARQTRRRG
jgi:hypothetical protein